MEEKGPTGLYDPRKYLELFYCRIRMPDEQPQLLETLLTKYQEFFAKVPSGGKLVDIGTGATVHTLITASNKFKNITCAEYTELSRKELKKWLSGAQDAFDWSLVFKFVAILEGHSESEYIKTLEERVRSSVNDVVYCNVLEDPILGGPATVFDVVSSTLCLEEACKSHNDLSAAVKRMAGILKTNGHLIMTMLMEQSSYNFGDDVISCLPITDEQLAETLKEAGFVIEELHSYMPDPTDPAEFENDFSHALFILAKKL